MYILPHFPHFSSFQLFKAILHKKHIEKTDFDMCLECTAAQLWLKYKTDKLMKWLDFQLNETSHIKNK